MDPQAIPMFRLIFTIDAISLPSLAQGQAACRVGYRQAIGFHRVPPKTLREIK